MKAIIVARALIVLTFCLILLGGVVHTTGSSLACPDWPLCFGEVMPPMHGGILYEHSHRLLGSAVGLCTLVLFALLYARRAMRRIALVGVGLVCIQGLLGGLTVIYRLPPLVSVAHFSTSMLFFAWALLMHWSVNKPTKPYLPALYPRLQLATILVYLQMVVGALVRHTHASLACGLNVVMCGPHIIPTNGLQWLQTTHRLLALLVLAAVIVATVPLMRWARSQTTQKPLYRLCLLSHVLILLQIILGILTIKTAIHLHVVTTHLALGVLLWATMVRLCLLKNKVPEAAG